LGGAAAGRGGGAAGFAAAGGFFLGSTAGACASAMSLDSGKTIDTAGSSASAGTTVPASSRLLSFMVIPGKRSVALSVTRCQGGSDDAMTRQRQGEFMKPN
jgi:hypothetical protein